MQFQLRYNYLLQSYATLNKFHFSMFLHFANGIIISYEGNILTPQKCSRRFSKCILFDWDLDHS